MHRILIIDDEPLLRYTLSYALRNDGIAVDTASSGIDALASVAREETDLCLLDLCLPDIHGLEVMRRIKELSAKTIIIIMSASYITEAMKKEIDAGAHLFIPKPFELLSMKEAVMQLLSGNGNADGGSPRLSAQKQQENRRYARKAFTQTLHYSFLYFDDLLPVKRQGVGETIDISEGGLGMRTNCPVEVGSIIRFRLLTALYELTAGVVRSLLPLDNSLYRLGVEFI